MTQNEKAVLAVNEAFYSAFIRNDAAAMESIWSQAEAIAVIHPGRSPLHGREAVMDSWRRLFVGSSGNSMHCRDARAYVFQGTAFVICTECFREAELAATNIYVLEGQSWKMVHHQAGPKPETGHTIATESLH